MSMTYDMAIIMWLIVTAVLSNLLTLVMFNWLTILSNLMVNFGVGIGIGSIWSKKRSD